MVTNIMGRSFSGKKQGNNLDNLDILSSLADFQNISTAFDKEESEGGGSLFGCYTEFGFCISSSVMVAINEKTVTEGHIMTQVARGLAEYLTSGDIVNTWQDLRKIDHVLMAANCLKKLKLC